MTENAETGHLDLGVSFGPDQGHFRLFSATASQAWLGILDDRHESVVSELELEKSEADIFSISSDLLKPGIGYVIRVAGPKGPRNSFRPELNLIDPFAKAVVRKSARDYYNVAVSNSFDWQGVLKPTTPLDESVIYETHV